MYYSYIFSKTKKIGSMIEDNNVIYCLRILIIYCSRCFHKNKVRIKKLDLLHHIGCLVRLKAFLRSMVYGVRIKIDWSDFNEYTSRY